MTGSAEAGAGKADFSHIYDRPDPRDYFRTLGELDYEIPQRALPVFQALLTALRSGPEAAGAAPLRVLDLCCSYGVNAALLRCDVSLDELFDHYASPALADLSPAELSREDEAYYAERCRLDAVRVSGLDVAGDAVAYGCRVGLLDGGWAEDLEAGDPSRQLTDHLDGVDLVTTTGGVGYITERTFDRVLGARRDGSTPWVAAFALRMFSYDRISETLAQHGLVTEQLTGVTFPQRRFASEAEREAALREVSGRGLDPAGREDTGRYHADFYLSRPAAPCRSRATLRPQLRLGRAHRPELVAQLTLVGAAKVVLEVAAELNARPRKTLGGITPAQAMQRLLFDPQAPHRCDDRLNSRAGLGYPCRPLR